MTSLTSEFQEIAAKETNWSSMFEPNTIGEFTQTIDYGVNTALFRVTIVNNVTGKSEIAFVLSTYEPRFGIDIADMADINNISEQLCITLESK
jgi:hypothetical protein